MNFTRRSALMTMSAALAAAGMPRLAFGQDGDTINLAMLAPLTGPNAFTGQREIAGCKDAVDYFNSQGGAGGKQSSSSSPSTSNTRSTSAWRSGRRR